MDRTGRFTDGHCVSTIVIADTEANQLQFQRDEDATIVHIESIADQIINFDDAQLKRRLVGALPILPSKPGQIIPHQAIFLRPFVRAICNSFQHLTDAMDKAFVKHNTKEMMKIQEDPWENYLYYDSKHVLPLVCHAIDLPIEKQVLLAMFIKSAISDETISQYKPSGAKLIDALINFIDNEFDFASRGGVQDEAETDEDDIDSLLVSPFATSASQSHDAYSFFLIRNPWLRKAFSPKFVNSASREAAWQVPKLS